MSEEKKTIEEQHLETLIKLKAYLTQYDELNKKEIDALNYAIALIARTSGIV